MATTAAYLHAYTIVPIRTDLQLGMIKVMCVYATACPSQTALSHSCSVHCVQCWPRPPGRWGSEHGGCLKDCTPSMRPSPPCVPAFSILHAVNMSFRYVIPCPHRYECDTAWRSWASRYGIRLFDSLHQHRNVHATIHEAMLFLIIPRTAGCYDKFLGPLLAA